MENRRKSGERRSFGRSETFPFTNAKGCCLRVSRSRIPDRRLNNLEVEWLSMALVHDEIIRTCKSTPAATTISPEPLAKRIKG